jgi:spore coat polysaccharide biosynthesis protein SpsF (cytidylyltransferase family)
MSTLAVVQARMGSTRLPGKVLMQLGGYSVLELLVRRLSRAHLDLVVIATSDLPQDDPIAEIATAMGVPCTRGPERDVLARYVCALNAHPSSVIVRITADCPLVDPHVVDAAVAKHASTAAHYCSNTLVRTYPDGLDVEVLSAEALLEAAREANDPAEREHVTPFIYRRPERYRIAQITSGEPRLGRERWTLDEEWDLQGLRAICDNLSDPVSANWREILAAAGRVAVFDHVDVVPEPAQSGLLSSRRWQVVKGETAVGSAVVELAGAGVGTLRVACGPCDRDAAKRAVRRALRSDLQIVELREASDDPT